MTGIWKLFKLNKIEIDLLDCILFRELKFVSLKILVERLFKQNGEILCKSVYINRVFQDNKISIHRIKVNTNKNKKNQNK